MARAVVLATGGSGKVYLYTSNPDVATGDGVAMAYRVGARVANMEFFQFHPTCLYHPAAKSFLITEAMRGEGGILRLRDGTAFMPRYHEMKDLAPRDVVSRAIDAEMKRTGDDFVVLDMTHLSGDFLVERFPNIHKRCMELGIDMRTQPIPVVPAAHYSCGGVAVDEHGAVDGAQPVRDRRGVDDRAARRLPPGVQLAARGDGVRGARRGRRARRRGRSRPAHVAPWYAGEAGSSDEAVVVSHNWDEIRRLMWNYVGIVRSDRRLERAARRIELIRDEIRDYYWNVAITGDLVELRNIALVARPDHRVRAPPPGEPRPALQHRSPDHDPRLARDTIVVRGDGPGRVGEVSCPRLRAGASR